MIKKITVTSIFVFLALTSWAQLIEFPVPRSIKNSVNTSARVQSTTPISLPFWDDFSWATSDKPDTLWVNSETVSVNNGNGINPPSFNVATFDGLNESGVPYTTNPQESLLFGYTDSLLSRSIKMTEVPLAQRNTVFLSFFYQWSGYGEAPDSRDFLELQFKDNNSNWQSMLTLRATDVIKPDTFYHVMIRINQTEYYHDDFQFMFKSNGRKSGYYDTWNIDYVYLAANRFDTQTDYPDRTISSSLKPFLKNKYSSIPISHLNNNLTNNVGYSAMTIGNLTKNPIPSNYNIAAEIYAIDKQLNSTTQNQAIATTAPILPTLDPYEKRLIEFTNKIDLNPFTSYDSLLKMTFKVNLDTGQISTTGFPQLNFRVNDTIIQEFTFKDYYAYDDGSAEATAGLGGSGNSVGQKAVVMFPMLTNQRDTINGVSVYFAYHGQAAPTLVELQVYNSRNGKPGDLLHSEVIPAQQQSLNTFLTYKLQEGVPVRDTFFIGWEEIQQGKIARIGLDKNNDTGDKLYFNSNGTWEQNDRVSGSLMFRPLFGKAPVFTSTIGEERPTVSFYPNPNNGQFIMEGSIQGTQIFNAAGQPVPFESIEQSPDKWQVQISNPATGLYLIQYRTTSKLYSHKIIVR